MVSGIYPPDIGGPATYVPQLCRRLNDVGFEVTLVSLEDECGTKRAQEPWKRVFVPRNTSKLSRMLRVVYYLFRESRKCNYIFANGLFEEVGILSLMRPKRYFVAKVVGDPVWERTRNKNPRTKDIENFNVSKQKLKVRLQKRMLVYAMNRFNCISCPSEQLKILIQGWGVRKPIYPIWNGVQCRSRVIIPPTFDVIAVSRLVPWKNLTNLITAVSRCGLSLAICGDGPEYQSLQDKVKELRADVKFLGQLDPPKVLESVNASRVFALISTYEGLSFALLEAMMSGKRILVSNVPGNTDVIKNRITGIVVDPNSIEDICRGLEFLMQDTSMNDLLAENAYQIATTDFCSEKQLDKMISLIAGSS